jgi:hypothetical protein
LTPFTSKTIGLNRDMNLRKFWQECYSSFNAKVTARESSSNGIC